MSSEHIEIIVNCQQCGREFIPRRVDFLRGTWRTCPACRSRDASDERSPSAGVQQDGSEAHATGNQQREA